MPAGFAGTRSRWTRPERIQHGARRHRLGATADNSRCSRSRGLLGTTWRRNRGAGRSSRPGISGRGGFCTADLHRLSPPCSATIVGTSGFRAEKAICPQFALVHPSRLLGDEATRARSDTCHGRIANPAVRRLDRALLSHRLRSTRPAYPSFTRHSVASPQRATDARHEPDHGAMVLSTISRAGSGRALPRRGTRAR